MVSAFNVENKQIDIPSWGMYIYPPVLSMLTTGDLLRKAGDDVDIEDANNYKVVISQSCDIAYKKTKNILCLNCRTMKSGIINALSSEIDKSLKLVPDLSKGDLEASKKMILQQKLSFVMNTGFYQRWAVLPALKSVCPDMSVDLKNVEPMVPDKDIIKCKSINGENYYRVASLDPQYVAQLVWGYMQNACRPGAPDRNVEEWAKRVID